MKKKTCISLICFVMFPINNDDQISISINKKNTRLKLNAINYFSIPVNDPRYILILYALFKLYMPYNLRTRALLHTPWVCKTFIRT